MFQFPRFALNLLIDSVIRYTVIEFPHSDTSGSKLTSNSPERFAGSHVLHRFWIPRDPSQALNFLSIYFIFCGGKRTRTADICRAKATLYQLSYTPRLPN